MNDAQRKIEEQFLWRPSNYNPLAFVAQSYFEPQIDSTSISVSVTPAVEYDVSQFLKQIEERTSAARDFYHEAIVAHQLDRKPVNELEAFAIGQHAQDALFKSMSDELLSTAPEKQDEVIARFDLNRELLDWRIAESTPELSITPNLDKLQGAYLNYKVLHDLPYFEAEAHASPQIREVMDLAYEQFDLSKVAADFDKIEPRQIPEQLPEPAWLNREGCSPEVIRLIERVQNNVQQEIAEDGQKAAFEANTRKLEEQQRAERQADMDEYRKLTNPSYSDLEDAFERGEFKDYFTETRNHNRVTVDENAILGEPTSDQILKLSSRNMLSTRSDALTVETMVDYYQSIGGALEARTINTREGSQSVMIPRDQQAYNQVDRVLSLAYQDIQAEHEAQTAHFNTSNGDFHLLSTKQNIEAHKLSIDVAEKIEDRVADTDGIVKEYAAYSRSLNKDRIAELESKHPELAPKQEQEAIQEPARVSMKPVTDGYNTLEDTKQRIAQLREKHAARNVSDGAIVAPVTAPAEPVKETTPEVMAQPEAPELQADRKTETVTAGRLVDHGEAPYQNDPSNAKSYFVKLDHRGREVTTWGVDLPRAIQQSEVERGDYVEVENLGKQDVAIKTASGAEEVKHRNAWKISEAKTPEQEQKEEFERRQQEFQAMKLAAQKREEESQRQTQAVADQRMKDYLARYQANRPIAESIDPNSRAEKAQRVQKFSEQANEKAKPTTPGYDQVKAQMAAAVKASVERERDKNRGRV